MGSIFVLSLRAYIVPRDAELMKPGAKFTPDIFNYVKERASHYKQLRGGTPFHSPLFFKSILSFLSSLAFTGPCHEAIARAFIRGVGRISANPLLNSDPILILPFHSIIFIPSCLDTT